MHLSLEQKESQRKKECYYNRNWIESWIKDGEDIVTVRGGDGNINNAVVAKNHKIIWGYVRSDVNKFRSSIV